ncbi:S-layer family protein [Oxynema sp. CENA135]|uniref:beta strand repeat-containing protein n=1 Tax=Oxynema sp. CENA135 TaxID=984206 RepID=UPI00190D122C|nr:S-layer family protein [Oxynema sp. CENA135]MBK4729454.1 S-layer family protein [Oxynema sp. CENA135]
MSNERYPLLSATAIAAIAISVGETSLAQLLPDASLGDEASRLRRETPATTTIEGGARRAGNLFHSFREFNIGDGQAVWFANPPGVKNILMRVTGNNPSNIFGTLGVRGSANLFSLNPNGFIFGGNARLDLRGAFVATTAEAIALSDGSLFGAFPGSNADTAPLLSVAVPTGLQYGGNPAPIQFQQADLDLSPGQNVTFLGGDVRFADSRLRAPGGRIELGGLSGSGAIALNPFVPSEGSGRADLSLVNSDLNVLAGGGGEIAIRAGNVELIASSLDAGLFNGLGGPGAVAGNIEIEATGALVLRENSRIVNTVLPSAIGRGGDIAIAADSAIVRDSIVATESASQGDAGNIAVAVSGLLDLASTEPFRGRPPQFQGGPQDTTIANSDNPPMRFNTLLTTIARGGGTGNAGQLTVSAGEIRLDGRVRLSSETESAGNGGELFLETRSLVVTGGALVSSLAAGSGNAGNITIRADTIDLSDRGNNFNLSGGIIATVSRRASRGNGGNIAIETRRMTVRESAIVASDLFAEGTGGSITIRASERLTLIGQEEGKPVSQLVTAVQRSGRGNGGDILVETQRLVLRDGAKIDVGTEGIGDGGNLTLRASERIELSGVSAQGFTSRLVAQSDRDAVGVGGDIVVDTSELVLRDGAQISAATFGESDGGSVFVRARKSVTAIGGFPVSASTVDNLSEFVRDESGQRYPSGIFASSPGSGNVNALRVETGRLEVGDGAQLSVSSDNRGAAGNLSVVAEQLRLNRGTLTADTVEGDRANIVLQVPDIQLRGRSQIGTNARGNATGGNIEIATQTLLALENSDITANAQESFAGRVEISAVGIFGTQFRPRPTPRSDITASSQLGPQFRGIVELNTPEVNPASGLVLTPDSFQDPLEQVVSGCPATRGNRFTIAGRGGLPEDPRQFLLGQGAVRDFHFYASETPTSPSRSRHRRAVLEATAWQVNPQGNIELVAPARKGDRSVCLGESG